MKYSHFIVIFFGLLISCNQEEKELQPVDYVNPLVGTDAHGHTFPGATRPFGMVQLSPDTREEGWDGCGGYHYSDDFVYGFSHTHLSGTGVPDYADVLLLPFTGELKRNKKDIPGSSFKHRNEIAIPGYYASHLDDYNIDVSLTTSPRVGFHKYTFNDSEEAKLYIDLKYRDVVTDASIQIINDTQIAGYRHSTAWANDQRLFFYMEFSHPFTVDEILIDGEKTLKTSINGKDIKAFLSFSLEEDSDLMVKVGISAVDIKGADVNQIAEIPHWDFEKIKRDAYNSWNKELSKIEVKGGSEEERRVFYTALYHSFIAPNLYVDVDGRYRGHDMEIHQSEDHDHYTVFSLWDTFRAAHPLFTLVQAERTLDFINTMLRQYEQGGRLPVWELAANETDCMIGYHSIPVIVDAYFKGLTDFDVELAYEAMIHSANSGLYGLDAYSRYGFIPAEEEAESVSKTLEYAYDDWCIAQMANAFGRPEDYELYLRRAQSYKNLFNPETAFMRARHNGRWFTPFDPREVNFNFTEANSWQYSFFVPQDINTLIEMHGGETPFETKLDQLFTETSETTGRQQSDISGLIGQYAHGNEPSHHMAYLYNYLGKPWKTQKIVRQIMDDLYTSKPDGLCGNEDCGQMSAWYVMSAMGMYPVSPGDNKYIFGSPIFDEVTLHLENGETFTIRAKNNSKKNLYIQSALLNGNQHSASYILHDRIVEGGELIFEMGSEPNKQWGVNIQDRPVNRITDFKIVSVPYLIKGERTFKKETLVELASLEQDSDIYFTLDGSEPDENSSLYSSPFIVDHNCVLKAIAVNASGRSRLLEAAFNKIDMARSIEVFSEYANQYAAGGDVALIDQIRGGSDFRTGAWQGYHGVDLEAVVDLGSVKEVSKIETHFLQDNNAWIFMPKRVTYMTSLDGQNYTELEIITNSIDLELSGSIIQAFGSNKKVKAQYIKIIAENPKVCPSWHKGADKPCWIFADEIIIN